MSSRDHKLKLGRSESWSATFRPRCAAKIRRGEKTSDRRPCVPALSFGDGQRVTHVVADSGRAEIKTRRFGIVSTTAPLGPVGALCSVRQDFHLPAEYDSIQSVAAILEAFRGRPKRMPIQLVSGQSFNAAAGTEFGRRRPSVAMPLALVCTQVRVTAIVIEPLQSLTLNAAIAEGHPSIRSFRAEWDELNDGREGRGWDDNPWVWATRFARVQGQSR